MSIGCKRNCTIGLVPIKCETSLNESGLITERELITRCCNKKTIRNNPESAINILYPIEV